jgi:hypothetical protein
MFAQNTSVLLPKDKLDISLCKPTVWDQQSHNLDKISLHYNLNRQ